MRPAFITARCWRAWRFWLIVAITAGMAWRLTDYFLRFPVWDDEASLGLNIVHRGYMGLMRPLSNAQVCPIGFLWISKFFIQHFGTDVWVLRCVPLMAGLAAVLLAWTIFKSFAGRRVGLLATALIACSLATSRFSTDFKPYSLDLLSALGIIGLTLRAIRRPHDYRPMIILVLITPVVMATSYPSLFVIGAALAALSPTLWPSRHRRWRIEPRLNGLSNIDSGQSTVRGTVSKTVSSRPLTHWPRIGRTIYLLWVIVAAGTIAVLYRGIIRGQMRHTHTFMQKFWSSAFPPHGLAIIKWLIDAHISNMMSYPFGGSKGIALVIAPLVLLGLVRLWYKRRLAELVLLAGPFVLTFIAAYLHKYPYGADARVEQHLAPSIALLAALGTVTLVALILRRSRNVRVWRNAVNIPVAVMVVFAVIMTLKDIDHPWRTPAPRRARNFIARVFSHAGADTRILILNKHPFGYSVLISWQLVTAQHSFLISPNVSALRHLAGNNVWLIHFHLADAAPLAPRILWIVRRQVHGGRITANITNRLYSPSNNRTQIFMQAVHITAVTATKLR